MIDEEIQFLAYADGELDAEETTEIERLLKSDPRAQRQLRNYRKTAVLLRSACADAFYRDVPEKLVATAETDYPVAIPSLRLLGRRKPSTEALIHRPTPSLCFKIIIASTG